MSKIFHPDNPIQKYGNLLADYFILSVLWIVFSIPIITVGAATTALFYVSTRRIFDKEGSLAGDFWRSFLLNLKQATMCWLFVLLAAMILLINITNIDLLGSLSNIGLLIQLCFAMELCAVSTYIFPIIARFELSTLNVFKNAFFMANRHLFTTLILMFVGVGAILLSLLTVIFTPVAVGLYAYTASHLIMRVFRTYQPEIDRDEELE